ncbi:cysteine hydrolase family protein [Gluconobacter roseus]|uniref:cysteine hydrolase family protein n=1 Tax=Gluconobacter roseus TaxID=586239 RepID=UPI0038D02462
MGLEDSLKSGRRRHICVDMQNMFFKKTAWHAPWLARILPTVHQLVATQPEKTVFTRFIPPVDVEDASGAWQDYYRHWHQMTRSRLGEDMLDVVDDLKTFIPPAQVVDKKGYSPWHEGKLQKHLEGQNIETLVITGGETDVCVLATLLGALDYNYRAVLITDGVYSSIDSTHDQLLGFYRLRFTNQITTWTAEEFRKHLKQA